MLVRSARRRAPLARLRRWPYPPLVRRRAARCAANILAATLSRAQVLRADAARAGRQRKMRSPRPIFGYWWNNGAQPGGVRDGLRTTPARNPEPIQGGRPRGSNNGRHTINASAIRGSRTRTQNRRQSFQWRRVPWKAWGASVGSIAAIGTLQHVPRNPALHSGRPKSRTAGTGFTWKNRSPDPATRVVLMFSISPT